MNVLVTGGAGFIGSHLTEYLLTKGNDVTVLDSLLRGNKIRSEILRSVRFVKGDIRDNSLVKKGCKGQEVVYHLAAVLGVDIVADNPMETMEVEALGIGNLVEACIVHGVQNIVYASTSGIYGKRIIDESVTENMSVDPASSYSIAKRYNEIYLASAFQEKGMNSVSARLFNVYGPRQDERMVLPRFVKQALSSQPITVYGTGKQTRDFTYVDDVVKALVMLGENVRGAEIFNVSKGKDIPIIDVAIAVKQLLHSSSEIVKVNVPKSRYDFEVEKRCGNSDKLAKATGFRPSMEFDEGFKKTYSHLIK